MAKPDFRIPYRHVNFLWVSNHYDVHLEGLCLVRGKIMRFEMPRDRFREEMPRLHVFKLGFLEKLHWLAKKKAFEICVGKHWTYPDRKHGVHFHIRKPEWLSRLLLNVYYKRRV